MDAYIASEEHLHIGAPWLNTHRMNAHQIFMLLVTVLMPMLECAAVVAGTATCPQQKQIAEAALQLLADGNAAFEAGDLAKAEARWTEIRECAHATADWPKAVFNLGLLEYRRKNLRQAIGYFDEVLQSHPNDNEPGANIMETNRNYSHRSAFKISQCYEAMGAYHLALRYAWLAKTKYRYYSWCGTCYDGAIFAVNKRIAYLTVRASRVHIWASVLVVGFFALRKSKVENGKRRSKTT